MQLPSLGYDPLALPPDWSFINIANTLLHRVSVLATQYSRSMKLRMVRCIVFATKLLFIDSEISCVQPMPESGEAPVDLEAPFCIEVAAGSFSRLHALLEQVSGLHCCSKLHEAACNACC